MKTKQFLFLGLACLSTQFTNAQATAANAANTTTATSYLGSGATSNFDVLFKRNNVSAGLLGTTKTAFGVNALAMPNSVSIGVGSGQFSSGVGNNTYLGQNAGKGVNTAFNSGGSNTFIGFSSGLANTTGNSNTYVGVGTGIQTTIGFGNTLLGAGAGASYILGSGNIALGYGSGRAQGGNNNIFLGNNAGSEDGAIGDNNIFIGNYSGYYSGGSNVLEIDNNDTDSPLIWGDLLNNRLKLQGKVGIGGSDVTGFGNFPTTSGAVNNVANYKLFVKGGILTEEIRVSLATTWADYVFAKDYKMPSLPELEKQIQEKGHLPNMPSAKEVKENGVELGEMAKMQQEKIEELTLYIIQINKELQELKAKLKN